MISPRSLHRLLFLGLCMAAAFSGVAEAGKGKGGKSGRADDFEDYWHIDPEEDNVESPPAVAFTSTSDPTGAPSGAPSGKPTQAPSLLPSASPSCTHSSSPSNSPSASPTATPSVSAVPSQSPAPTTSAVPSQSPAPTTTPSQSPAPSTSALPSQSPAPTTTLGRTETVAPSLSTSPTTTAVPSVSSAPTVELCTTNDGGFGESTSEAIVVSFGYELEYEAGYDTISVVSDLESSFNDFLLPLLFPAECPSPTTSRVLSFSRRLETVGVSKLPDDVPLSGVSCAEKSDEANECIVMDGALTVYTDDGTPSTGEDEIRSALQGGMQAGDFEESPIVRVSYVDVETDPNTISNDGNNRVNTPGGRGRRMVYGVVAGVATLLLVALAVLWRRKKKRDDETNLSSTLENETLEANETTVDNDGV